MKRLLLAALMLGPGVLAAAPATYALDPEHMTIAFLTEHIGYAKVLGSFRKATGTYTFDETTNTLGNVRIVIDAASVDTGHERRDQHLRSGDFLDTAKFPRMTFTAQGAHPVGERRYAVMGQLELRGVTRPVTLEATVNKSAVYPMGDKAHVMGVSARGTLQRSDFGMTYSVENGWVGDAVELLIEFEARRQ
jgi:polyisoprenoid-binding protein YceI